MTRVAVLSDTHGLLRPEVIQIVTGCDAIIHGGDINNQKILDQLSALAPLYVVRGNNDKEWAEHLPESITIQIEDCVLFVVHNKKFVPSELHGIDAVIFGHSHKYAEQMIDGRRWRSGFGSEQPRTPADLPMPPGWWPYPPNRTR